MKIVVMFVCCWIWLFSVGVNAAPHFDEKYLAWKASQEAYDRSLAQASMQDVRSRPRQVTPQQTQAPVETKQNTTAAVGEQTAPATSQAIAVLTVHLNQADVQQLQQLKGIGEKKAREIIQYREQHGPFKRVEDLKQVKGIGERTFLNNQAQLAL